MSEFVLFLRKVFYNENIKSLEDVREIFESELLKNTRLDKNEVEYIMDVKKLCKNIGKKKRNIKAIVDSDESSSSEYEPMVDIEGSGLSERPNKPHVTSTHPKSSLIGSASRSNKQKESEEKKKQKEQKSYLESCKKIGRLGPLITRIDNEGTFGAHKMRGKRQKFEDIGNKLDIEAKGSFTSIRANTCFCKGKWYYEVKLLTGGLFQIGWVSIF